MGGAAQPPPQWTGIDKVVRGYLPGDDQRTSPTVLYCTLFNKYKLKFLIPLHSHVSPWFLLLSFNNTVAGAILSGYGALIAIAVIRSKLKGPAPVEEVPAASTAPVAAITGGVPSVESPEFEKYVESDAFTNMIESEEQLLQWVASVE